MIMQPRPDSGSRGVSPLPKPLGAHGLRSAAIILGVWLTIGLLTTQFSYLALQRTNSPASWTALFAANLFSVLLWSAFTPIIVWLAWRFPPQGRRWVRHVAIHIVACVVLAVVDVLVEHPLGALLGMALSQQDAVTVFLRRLFLNSLCYTAVVAIATVLIYARLTQDREQAAARLSSQLAAARLQALQAQLQPHFLFNTLSMIAEQVHADPEGADHMISRLGQLLRASLATGGQQEVSLAEELGLLRAYLDIMAVRLSGRARFEVHADPESLDAAVPVLLLQPLAENAYRHGIETLRTGGQLTISTRRHPDAVEIEIADNGRGFDPEAYQEGVGMRVVRERLAALYGDAATIHLRQRVNGGTIAVVRLPFRHLSNGLEATGVDAGQRAFA